ncbi:MAG: PepSY-associated TM helix domain-containing protein [Nannocystaceae bacterium]
MNRSIRWRPWLRALHRDAGYLAVGLTVIYALSGLAVNHIEDWDPNFDNYEETHQVALPLPADDKALADHVLRELSIDEAPSDVFRVDTSEVSVLLENRTLHVRSDTGEIREEGQRPRFLLRVANWLHLNRGKKAWTYVADTYAAGLLLLALSGMFMIPGRRGLLGRGAILVVLGAAVPILYVTLSGGP